MNLSGLANSICSLTHRIDALEKLRSSMVIDCNREQDFSLDLGMEIARLHGVLDDLNALYEDATDRHLDHAFERF